jgi:hypothetical protein
MIARQATVLRDAPSSAVLLRSSQSVTRPATMPVRPIENGVAERGREFYRRATVSKVECMSSSYS